MIKLTTVVSYLIMMKFLSSFGLSSVQMYWVGVSYKQPRSVE